MRRKNQETATQGTWSMANGKGMASDVFSAFAALGIVLRQLIRHKQCN
jgi:hypothetical protein